MSKCVRAASVVFGLTVLIVGTANADPAGDEQSLVQDIVNEVDRQLASEDSPSLEQMERLLRIVDYFKVPQQSSSPPALGQGSETQS